MNFQPLSSEPYEARFSVAPMIDWTDRHCRYFHRLLSKRARLYTEMIVADAILHGDRDYLLGFDPAEHPVALQLGGSDPEKMAQAAQIGVTYGYDEINLNIGCPSDRVQSGTFGACLMAQPELVAQCYAAIASAVEVPVTIKCRIGIDTQEPEKTLPEFIETIAASGCQVFIIHARKAWLQGLSPKENRTVPPLEYELVSKIKRKYPELSIILNGGVLTLHETVTHLKNFDGVMMGRGAYENPWQLSQIDAMLYGEVPNTVDRHDIARQMIPYIEQQMAASRMRVANIQSKYPDAKVKPLRPHNITRHMIGLFHGQPGARAWRQMLTMEAAKIDAGPDIIEQALAVLPKADIAC